MGKMGEASNELNGTAAMRHMGAYLRNERERREEFIEGRLNSPDELMKVYAGMAGDQHLFMFHVARLFKNGHDPEGLAHAVREFKDTMEWYAANVTAEVPHEQRRQ